MLRNLFGKYLLITNTVSCGLMMGTGDILQQSHERWRRNQLKSQSASLLNGTGTSEEDASPQNRSSNDFDNINDETYTYNYTRTRNMFIVGLLQGPFHHYFYTILDRVLPGRNPMSILKKTALDQTIASPTCLTIFFVGLGILDSKDFREIYDEIKLKLCDTWKVDCCFWPPTQCINFMFVPLRYRVLYTNFMTMIYDGFLSYMKYDVKYS